MPNQQLSVLLVEDDDLDAEVVKRSFAKHDVNASLKRAENGSDALTLLEAQDRDVAAGPLVVFLDLNMPGVNGHEFLSRLRSDDRFKKTTVFVLTTSDHERDVEMAYNKNVAGYFTKKNLNKLIDVLNCYIDGALLPPV